MTKLIQRTNIAQRDKQHGKIGSMSRNSVVERFVEMSMAAEYYFLSFIVRISCN